MPTRDRSASRLRSTRRSCPPTSGMRRTCPPSPSPTGTYPAARSPCTPPDLIAPAVGRTRSGSCTSTPESSCSASSTKPPTPAPSRSSPTPPIYQGPCPPTAGTALLSSRRPWGLASGAEERLDRPETGHPGPGRRHHHAYLCTVPHGVEQCEDTQAGRCGVTRACYCQHKTHPVNTTEVSPGPERETSAENGTGRVGTIRHTAENEGRTPR